MVHRQPSEYVFCNHQGEQGRYWPECVGGAKCNFWSKMSKTAVAPVSQQGKCFPGDFISGRQSEKCGFNFYVHHFPSSRSGYLFLLLYLMTTILRNCQATQNTTYVRYDPWFVIVRMKNSFSCLTFGLKILPIDFESLEKLVSGGIFSIRSFSDKTNYILPCQEKDRTPAHIWEVVFSFLVSLRTTSWMISSEVVKLFLM